MDEDEDAFLYGDDGPTQGNGGGGGVSNGKALPPGETTTTKGKAVEGIEHVSVTNGAKDGNGDADGDKEEEEEDKGDEEEEEEEDSDSDLEIIVDSGAVDAARPPPGYNQRPLQTFNKTLQAQRAAQQAAAAVASEEYTPLTRPGQSNAAAASLAALTGDSGASAERKALTAQPQLSASQAYALQQQQQLTSLPEGPPPPAPSTAPRIDLNPSDQALMLPPDVVGGEAGPLIYHVDPLEMEEKPWRRPGADVTDWFNYGFNEETWRDWGERKTHVNADRLTMEQEHKQGIRTERSQAQHESAFNGGSSSSGMPSQQAGMMQSMMAAFGLGGGMTTDQMMSFMGMPSAGNGFGMGGGGMMGSMGGMFPFGSGGAGGGNAMPMMRMGQNQPMNGGPPGSMDDGGQGMPYAEHAQSADSQHPQGEEGQARHTDDFAHQTTGPPSGAPSGPSGWNEPPQGAPTGPGSSSKDQGGRDPLPQSVPTGPKGGNSSSRRYNDRDTGTGAADALDYGANNREESNDSERRNSSYGANSHHQKQSYRRSPSLGRTSGWDAESTQHRRSHSPAARGGSERDRSRRHGHREDRENSSTPRSSRHHEDDDLDDTRRGTSRRSSSGRTTSARDRSDRRRGAGGDEEASLASIDEEEGRSSSKRSQARSERRAGRDHEEEEGSKTTATSSSSRRSRKRGATEDNELLSPPRESRRRR